MSDHRIVGHDQKRRIESPSQLVKGQQVVRDERLQKILEGFYDAVGERTAVLLGDYHRMMVEPLALRVAYLELPFWRRWAMDIGALKSVIVSYFQSGKTTPTPDVDAAGPTAAPAGALPESDRGPEGAPSLLP